VLPDWLVSSPGGLFLWAGAVVFLLWAWGGKLGLLFFNLACFGLFSTPKNNISNFVLSSSSFFYKTFEERFTLRFTKEEEENK